MLRLLCLLVAAAAFAFWFEPGPVLRFADDRGWMGDDSARKIIQAVRWTSGAFWVAIVSVILFAILQVGATLRKGQADIASSNRRARGRRRNR